MRFLCGAVAAGYAHTPRLNCLQLPAVGSRDFLSEKRLLPESVSLLRGDFARRVCDTLKSWVVTAKVPCNHFAFKKLSIAPRLFFKNPTSSKPNSCSAITLSTPIMDPVFDNKWRSSDPASSVAMIVRLVLCIFALTVRLYCKKLKQTQKFISWDDGFIILALVSITVSEGICLWGKIESGIDWLLRLIVF